MLSTKLLKFMSLIFFFLLTNVNNYAAFIDEQLKYSRVKEAHEQKLSEITQNLDQLKCNISAFEVMIKAYKYEQELLVYVRSEKNNEWLTYKSFDFCATSGTLGPKIKQGDLQIPEGYYHLNHFNPYSSFHLSMGVSYPNKADKLKRPAADKGGAIYIHGSCVTIGCIPITDEPIKELYVLCVLAKNNGQTQIPIHILPFQFNDEKMKTALTYFPDHEEFWKNLAEIESDFDSTKRQGIIKINEKGNYYLQ